MGGISYKVLKEHEYGKSVYYRVACNCGEPSHDLSLEIEADEFPAMTLHFYGQYTIPHYWRQNNFFSRLWERVKFSLRVLFIGHVDVENDFMLMEEEHIDSFISALEEGKQKIKKAMEG